MPVPFPLFSLFPPATANTLLTGGKEGLNVPGGGPSSGGKTPAIDVPWAPVFGSVLSAAAQPVAGVAANPAESKAANIATDTNREFSADLEDHDFQALADGSVGKRNNCLPGNENWHSTIQDQGTEDSKKGEFFAQTPLAYRAPKSFTEDRPKEAEAQIEGNGQPGMMQGFHSSEKICAPELSDKTEADYGEHLAHDKDLSAASSSVKSGGQKKETEEARQGATCRIPNPPARGVSDPAISTESRNSTSYAKEQNSEHGKRDLESRDFSSKPTHCWKSEANAAGMTAASLTENAMGSVASPMFSEMTASQFSKLPQSREDGDRKIKENSLADVSVKNPKTEIAGLSSEEFLMRSPGETIEGIELGASILEGLATAKTSSSVSSAFVGGGETKVEGRNLKIESSPLESSRIPQSVIRFMAENLAKIIASALEESKCAAGNQESESVDFRLGWHCAQASGVGIGKSEIETTGSTIDEKSEHASATFAVKTSSGNLLCGALLSSGNEKAENLIDVAGGRNEETAEHALEINQVRTSEFTAKSAGVAARDTAKDAAIDPEQIDISRKLQENSNLGISSPHAANYSQKGGVQEKIAVPIYMEDRAQTTSVTCANEKKLLNIDGQGLEFQSPDVGTDVAKKATVLSNPHRSSCETPSRESFAPTAARMVQADEAVAAAKSESKQSKWEQPTRRTIEIVRDIAERLQSKAGSVVEFDLTSHLISKKGIRLSVRLEYKNGVLHTTFRTDSRELRDALAREWQVAMPAVVDGEHSVRIAKPLFTQHSKNQDANLDAETSLHQEQQEDSGQQEQDTPLSDPAFAGSTNSSRTATNAADEAASTDETLRPETTRNLHVFA